MNHRLKLLSTIGLALLLMFTFSPQAAASSATGSVAGYTTTATLSRYTDFATATTSCAAGSSTCTVSATLRYYYTKSDGTAAIGNVSANTAGSPPVTVTPTGTGKDVRSISASSTHYVFYMNQTWSATLNN